MTAAPILLGALVFQNVVPIIAKRFKGDTAKIRESVVLGSAAPAVAYIAFCASPGPARRGRGARRTARRQRGLPDELRGPACAALAVFSVTAVAGVFTVRRGRPARGDPRPRRRRRRFLERGHRRRGVFPPAARAGVVRARHPPLLSLTGGYAEHVSVRPVPCLLAWKHREALGGRRGDPARRPIYLSALGSGAATMVVSALGRRRARSGATRAAGSRPRSTKIRR